MAKGYVLTKAAVEIFLKEVKYILNDSKAELRIIDRKDKPDGYNNVMMRDFISQMHIIFSV